MKTLFLAILVSLSATAFAQDGAGYGAEDVIAAGGLTTVVGGCADARTISSGENTDIIYTEPCHVQRRPRFYRVVSSCADPLLFKRFAAEEQASAYCGQLNGNYQVSIGVTYDYGYRAYTCSCYNNQNGGE